MSDLVILKSDEFADIIVSRLRKILIDELKPQTVQQNSSPTYLTRAQVAQKLSITLFTVNEWTKKGKLSGYRIGRRVLYKENEVDKALTPIKTSALK
jgi:excisionase family DNA binding protein